MFTLPAESPDHLFYVPVPITLRIPVDPLDGFTKEEAPRIVAERLAELDLKVTLGGVPLETVVPALVDDESADEINPFHPTTRAMHGQWHKLLAIFMKKLGQSHIVLSAADVLATVDAGLNIAVQQLSDGIHLRLVNEAEARKLALQYGGVSDPGGN